MQQMEVMQAGSINLSEYSQQKLNDSKIIVLDTADDFSALFSSSEILVNIQI